jgi:hypothetical protein
MFTLACVALSVFVSLPLLLLPIAILRFVGDAVEMTPNADGVAVSWVLLQRSRFRIAWWVAGNVATTGVLILLFVTANHSLLYLLRNH